MPYDPVPMAPLPRIAVRCKSGPPHDCHLLDSNRADNVLNSLIHNTHVNCRQEHTQRNAHWPDWWSTTAVILLNNRNPVGPFLWASQSEIPGIRSSLELMSLN